MSRKKKKLISFFDEIIEYLSNGNGTIRKNNIIRIKERT